MKLRRATYIFLGSFASLLSVALGESPLPRYEPIPVAIESIEFDRPEIEKRFRNLDAAAKHAAKVGFEHETYRRLYGPDSKVVNACWAKGWPLNAGYVEYVSTEPLEKMTQKHRITIFVRSRQFPQTMLIGVDAHFFSPRPDNWSVRLAYWEGANVFFPAPHWECHIYHWDAAKYEISKPFYPTQQTTDSIKIPLRGYKVRDSVIDITKGTKRDVATSFLRYARSAEDLLNTYLADLKALEDQAIPLIQEHRARKIVVKPRPRGDDKVPKEVPTPLTAEEEAVELEKAHAYFAKQKRLMTDHHKEIYLAIQKAFPLDVGWPEIKER